MTSLATTCRPKGGMLFRRACWGPSDLLGSVPPQLPGAPEQQQKDHSAGFNCVHLPNPRPWHFCFRSQTLLVFLGVSVPLKDIIKPFFSPLKNVGPSGTSPSRLVSAL